MRYYQTIVVPLLVFGALAGSARESTGQPPPPGVFGGGNFGPINRPAFSPYLNLLRPNSNPVINYYGLVRPQFQAQAAFQSLQGQINPLTNSENDALVTGHAFGFQNSRFYFQNQLSAGGFAPGAPAGRYNPGMGGRNGNAAGNGPLSGGQNIGGQPPRR